MKISLPMRICLYIIHNNVATVMHSSDTENWQSVDFHRPVFYQL